MEESTLRWPTHKEREEMEEVCSVCTCFTGRRELTVLTNYSVELFNKRACLY